MVQSLARAWRAAVRGSVGSLAFFGGQGAEAVGKKSKRERACGKEYQKRKKCVVCGVRRGVVGWPGVG